MRGCSVLVLLAAGVGRRLEHNDFMSFVPDCALDSTFTHLAYRCFEHIHLTSMNMFPFWFPQRFAKSQVYDLAGAVVTSCKRVASRMRGEDKVLHA